MAILAGSPTNQDREKNCFGGFSPPEAKEINYQTMDTTTRASEEPPVVVDTLAQRKAATEDTSIHILPSLFILP